MIPFSRLVYHERVVGSDDREPGTLVGCDRLGNPYEVMDVVHADEEGKAYVHLQQATPENINRQIPRLLAMLKKGQV